LVVCRRRLAHDSHAPVDDSHAPVDDSHAPVDDSHAPVDDSHAPVDDSRARRRRGTFPSMIGKNFTVRLSPAEADLIEQIAADRGASSADVLRDAIRLYFRGEASKLRGPDEGYAAARALAGQLAHELLKEAQERLPRDHDAAVAWLAKRRTGARRPA
jgi:predicted transcriptional regulator